ncbi:hemagglutinin repeat-containing protein [Acinetobacter soli]|uniref:hemagglutinin repeat-containing protein n=1 Tax=Acinetobacter soli TaxID=487316 RepID=UPI0032B4710E
MNKNCYRVIFSQARGLFIAVAEIVKSQTKQAGQTSASTSADTVADTVSPIHYKKLNPLNFAVIGCLGALVISLPMSTVADTQIIADKSAPTSQQATILNSANGTTQVNIQTPSAGGVSRNTYTQFDVGQEGAILNNSRNNTQTQIGGWVQGNPWLAKGEAKVILNEVNSSNPSQLKGYIEVAGKQAQVVIANPSGLVCDGCGVINADRFTLTTGQAVMNQGYLESFRVREGQVTIDGKGLNGSLTPFTDIYTRALKVNAGLYANELNTVLGQNDIQVKDQVAPQITATTDATSAPISNFALDVGQLGGMYAGKIFLMGTEQGLGVRNAGTINSTQGMLSLNANGDLVNTGNVIANKDQVQLKAQNVQNTGNVSSATSQISIESQNLDNTGLISSADELHLNQQNRLNNSGTLNAARVVIDATSLKNSGSIEQTGTQGLDLKSGSMTNLGGKIGIAKNTTGSGTGGSAGGTGSETAPSNSAQDGGSLQVATPVDTTPKTYDQGYIHVKDQLNNDQGTIIANGGVDVESQNGLDNQGGQLNLGHVKIQGERFNNDQGQLTVKQAEIQTNTLSNQSGQLISNQKLNIQTQTTNNQKGKIQSVDQLDLNVVNSFDNTEGQIASGQQLNIQADQVKNQSGLIYSEQQGIELKANQVINNTSGIIQAKTQLNLASAQLGNTSGHIQAENIQQQHTTVNNTQGSIVAGQSFISTVDQFDNHQGLIDANNVQLTHQVLNNSGSIYADQNIKITGQHILNIGSIAAGQNIQLNTAKLQHEQAALIAAGLDRQGKLTNTGDLDITVDQTALHGKSFAGQHLKVASKQQIDATNGQLQAKNIDLASDTGDISTRAATVIAEQLSLKSHDLIDNQQGTLSAQYLNLTANRLDNSKGHILHTGQDLLDLNFSQSLNNQSGEIRSNAADLNIKTAILNNTEGQVVHAGTQPLNIQTAQLNGHLGQILSNGALQLKASTLDVSGGVTSADQIAIQANELNNTQGQLIQRGTSNPLNLVIQQQFNNQAGLIQSATATNIKAGSLNNQGGTLSSAQGQNLDVDVGGKLDNSQSGQIYAGNQAHLQVGSLDNSNQGQINAQQNLQLTSQQQINNQLGQIVTNGDVQIQSQGLDNSHGQIGSLQGGLSLNSGTDTLINQSGLIQAKKDVSIQAQRINNQQGQITTQGQADVISQAEIDNLEGAIAADLDVNIRSQGLNNNKGQISSAQGNLTLNAGNGTLTNQAATIVSGKTLTLSANQLDNSNHGQINSQNNADISIVKDINNTSGVIAAKQQLTLSSQGLNNTTGQIGTVQGNLHIDAGSQLLNNQQGRIQPGQDLNLNATGIDNTQGQISSKNQLQLDSRGQLLNNRQGTLSAKNLTIDSGELNNDQGLIQAQQSIQIDTHQHNLSNTNSGAQGGILSQGNIQLNNIQTLDNQQGYLASAQQLDLQANQILNQHGTVLAAKQLNLKGTGQNQLLNNQSGQLLSMGGMTLNIDQINNNGKANTADADSHITAAGELKISTQQLDNQNTLNTDPANASIQGINANTLNITSNVLNNQSGAIRSSANQNLNIQQLLNNQSGQISSEKQLTIQGDPLVIDNLGGQILAGTGLNLSAKSLSGDGKVLSLGNAILSLQNDYVHNANAQLQANQDLSLNTQGNITNNGTINAGNQLALNAANITNQQAGKIESHDTRLTAQNTLNNTGLINGDFTRLQAETLNNQGTGRIYGTTLAIQANTLNNQPDRTGTAPVIASRGDLHLGVKTLNNLSNPTDYTSQALIFSAGNLYLGAALDTNDQATGQADVIHNESATIESLGDMSLSAKQINNVNKYFKTEQVEVSRKEGLEKSFSSWRTFDGELIDLKNPKEDFSKYFYSEIILETQVTQSVPAQIRAGNKMDLSGAKVFNDKSQILAGGELKITDGNYESDKTEGIRQKIATGTQQLYEVRSGNDLDQKSPFKYVDKESINLVVSQALGNQRLNQNQLSTVAVSNNQSAEQVQNSKTTQQEINGLQTTKNSTQLNQTKGVDLDHLNLKDSQTQNAPQASVVDTNQQQSTTSAPSSTPQGTSEEIRTIDFSNIKVPNSALYKVNADSKAGYLIETDPAFADYKKWLSSDYMLDALGLDPALQQKRLGDGFYEQRLVQDQISNLTGYRFLEGFANDDAQYKALMNNGITFAKLYGLRPGIALTAAQTAQLTSDIVWLVEQSITLPNGTTTKALVPQVYVKARVGDLKGDGTLLSGNSVNLKLDGDLINGATIAGREAVQITADNVQNLNGRIQGNQVAIETQKDLNNIGGQIIAKDTMALKVGGNLNIESTTRTSESQVGNFSASSTNLDRVAGLYVGNGSTKQFDAKQATLVLNVAGNSSLKGAQINNSNGATVINTTGNVDLGIVSVGKQETLKINDKNGYQQKQQQDVGSQISSVGSLLINGQNINIKGSELSSEQGTTQISAVDHLNIEEGRKTSDMESQWSSKSKGLFGSTQKSSYLHNQSDEAIASSITGKNVLLNANNIDIRGSNIVSDELTQIQAKENVNITAAENYSSNESQQTKKKSGLTASFSDGVASVGYSKSSSDIKQQSSNVGLTQSQISSENGNTNIIAGQDLTTQAALLNAGKDLNLSAKNINLNAGYTSNEQHAEIQTKQSGLSVGVTYSSVLAGKSAYDKSMGDSQYSDSAVGQVMSQLNAVDKGMMAAQTPIVITGGSQKTQQNSNSSSSQAVVTEATAKGNLNIIANGGSISSEGAKLSAEGDALLHATENITLGFAKEHQDQNAQSKQSGFSIDNRDWAAPAGVYNNQKQGAAKADQVTGTQLSAGGKATLQTEKGDINILGSSVVAQQDVTLNAARDINIKSTQNSQSQSENSTNKGVGSAQISDTEKFFGYMNGNNQSKSNSVEQQRSQVGSLEGNVNIQAGNNYTQQVADVVAKKDVNVTAKQIEVLQDVNSSNAEQSGKDLKVGVFAKVSSPILDLINTADKASKSKADDRTQALQVMAAGAQSYQTYSDVKGGALFKAEAGIGFSSSSNQQSSQSNISQQNNIQAGGNVNLTSTEGNIHLQNTQVKAQDQINLDSAKNILLESGQNTDKADGKNSNVGLSVGYGVSVGAQTGAYIYGEAGYGKGSNHLDSTSQSNTTLNANQINIKSKGDTTLNGAQATANRIDTDVGGKLSIISQQDSIEQNNKQLGVGGRVQASLGTAWQASGNVSSSKASGSSNSVNQQSGLFAGEGGYHVKADSVDLKGGAISSTASKNNNDLTTNRLSFSNIENQSNYQATSVSLSGGMSGSKGKAGSDSNTTKAANPTSNENWRNATSFSPSLPQHQENKDNSTTYATLSEGNIIIGGKATTAKALGIHSDINTANRQVDTLPNLQEILDKQKTVADATSTIAAATRTYSQNQQAQAAADKQVAEQQAIAELQAQGGKDWEKYQNTTNPNEKQQILKNNSPSYQAASDLAQDWGMGGDKSRALNAVTMAVTGALGGQTDLQVAANTLAPYAANVIGEKFGHGEDKNTAAQMVSHAILGAALAYVNNGNPAAGGGAAVASEAAAGYLAERYNDGKTAINPKTGQFDPNLLPEDAKTQIRDLTAAIGAVVGGTVGDSAFNAQLAGVVGQNAVENNEFSIVTQGVEKVVVKNKKEKELKVKISANCKGQSCIIPVPEKTVSDNVVNLVNNLTSRQLAAVLGQDYDPLTGEQITPKERQIAKASALALGFSKSLSGVTKLSDDVLVAIEKKYGKNLLDKITNTRNDIPTESQISKVDLNANIDDGMQYIQYQNLNGGSNKWEWIWPENLGFKGEKVESTLKVGTKLDRVGEPTGSFLAPAGTPYEARALAPGSASAKVYHYEVIKPLPIVQGEIAPAFGQKGGGIQILPNVGQRVNVQWLIEKGYIKEIK